MLYLEDYLEMIEHLPQELRDRFTEMREMDLQVHNAMDNLEEQSKQFFSNAKNMRTDQRDVEYDKIKQDYYKTLEDAEEKVSLANQIYELVDKYLRRLDQELQKFKIELEADNAGITEVLERRSLELDNPPPIAVNHVREKRKYTFHNNNVNTNNTSYAGTHPERPHLASTSEKLLSTIAQEVYRGTPPNASPMSGGVITSSNITSNRLNSNAFTPLLAVVNANNANHPNGSNSSIPSPLIQSNSSLSVPEKSSASTGALPQGSFRCNLGNTAIAAAASQAIAATQQMQMGRRTASLKASYEAINSGFNNIYSFNPLRDHSLNNSSNSEPSNRTSNSFGYGYDLQASHKAGQSGRSNKRSRTSSQYGSDSASNSHISISNAFDDNNSSEAVTGDNNGAPDWTYDPNEPRYCICNNVSYGEMIACDNEECQKEWFHYGCVGITQSPKGKWYCPDCSDKMNKRKGRKERS